MDIDRVVTIVMASLIHVFCLLPPTIKINIIQNKSQKKTKI